MKKIEKIFLTLLVMCAVLLVFLLLISSCSTVIDGSGVDSTETVSENITHFPETEPILPETTINSSVKPHIKVPFEYEETSKGIRFKVEFSIEEYAIPDFEPLRIRVAIYYTNLTNKTIYFDAGKPSASGVFERNDGVCVYPKESDMHGIFEKDKEYRVTILPRDKHIDDVYFSVQDFFNLENTYTFSVEVETDQAKTCGVTIPIEILEKEVKPDFYQGTWYLSDWGYRLKYREENDDMFVNLPVLYEEATEGAFFKVEFFSETYALNSYIQCRVTVTNNTGSDVNVYRKSMFNHGGFIRDSQREVMLPYSNCKDRHGFYESAFGGYMSIANGETYVIESVFLATESFFEEGHEFSFLVEFSPMFANGERKTYSITIPVELCSSKAEST